MTTQELLREVHENLTLEGVDKLPSQERVLRAVNRAKNIVCGHLDLLDPMAMQRGEDVNVDQGDDSINLPYVAASNELDFRRLIGLYDLTQGGCEPVDVRDHRDDSIREDNRGFYLYRQGPLLVFNDLVNGAPRDMTLYMLYTGYPEDLTLTDVSGTIEIGGAGSTFANLGTDWCDLIAMKATIDLLPANNPGRTKWADDFAATLTLLRSLYEKPMDNRASYVGYVD